jgi:hypothetical protein
MYAFTKAYKCENDFEIIFQGSIAERVCTQACFTHTMCIIGSNKLKSSYWTKSSKMVDICYRPHKGETCLLHLCSASFLCSLGAGKYFLVRKLYQETGGYMFAPKSGKVRDI